MVTCFSDQAHSIVDNCNEIARKLQDKNAYKLPPELAALQGKTYIFQLHYGSESTKDNKLFFLDQAWDTTPALAATPATDSADPPTGIPLQTTSTTGTNTPVTDVEKSILLPETSLLKDEKKTTSARKPLFQTAEDKSEEPAPKKNKKND